MPKNINNVPKQELVMLSLNTERSFRFAPHVKQFGQTVTSPHEIVRIDSRNELEFCFRISSETQEFAEDYLDNVLYRNPFPHLFVKLPGVPYRYEFTGSRKAFFLIYPADMLSWFESTGIPLDPPCHSFTMTPEIEQILRELKRCYPSTRQYGAADKIDLLALRLIETVYFQRHLPENDTAEAAIRAIASYLEYHPTERIDLNELAEKHGLSRRSFFRHWKKFYGTSPSQYRQEKRMTLAAQLLLDRSWKIADLAEHLGYPDGAYFIQAFKHHYGKTPAAWRREQK